MLRLYWRLVFHPYLIRIIAITATIFLTSTLDVLSIGMIVPVVSIMIAPEESSSTWIADMVQNVTNRANLGNNYQVVVFAGLAAIVVLVIIKNINNRKIISVIEAILNSALTLFLLFNSILKNFEVRF